VAVGRNKRILGDIGCRICIAEHTKAQAVGAILVALDELVKAVVVTR
jgi:hypothetical protein